MMTAGITIQKSWKDYEPDLFSVIKKTWVYAFGTLNDDGTLEILFSKYALYFDEKGDVCPTNDEDEECELKIPGVNEENMLYVFRNLLKENTKQYPWLISLYSYVGIDV